MRKFLMAAALLAVAACGEKKANNPDTTAAMAPTMAPVDTSKHDTTGMMKADTGMKPMTAPDTTKKP